MYLLKFFSKTTQNAFLIIMSLSLLSTLHAQASEGEKNFREIERLITTPNVDIAGMLLLPNHQRSDSLVILSSGSSWQDRDSTLYGFKLFKVMAEHMASQGIASFRFDDRGVGKSTGDFVNSTLGDLVTDIDDIITFFTGSDQYQHQSFILLGHSQGGIVSTKAASTNEAVTGIVLVASPGVTIGDLVLSQIRSEHHSATRSVSALESFVSANNVLMRAIYEGREIRQALQDFRDSYAKLLSTNKPSASLSEKEFKENVNDFANEMKVVYGLPSLTSFLYYDPPPDLQQLTVPILSLHGARDRQVTIEPNKDCIETTLRQSGNEYRIVVFDDANHLFQTAQTGLREEYESLEKDFVEGFLEEISSWILSL